MAEWNEDELTRIGAADDLHISPSRGDGVTYGTPTWIWSVVVERNPYVRAYNGQKSRWSQAAMKQKRGRISVAGITKEVDFESADRMRNGCIDDACRAKYKSSPYLDTMINATAPQPSKSSLSNETRYT